MNQERELQEKIVNFLSKREEFQGTRVAFIVEDKEDPFKAVQKAVASTVGLAVVISAVGYRRRANSGEAITGTLSLQLDIFENITLNRAAKDRMTGQAANEIIRALLHWQRFEGLGRLRFIDSRRNDGPSLASWESNWEIEIGADEIRWGAEGSLFGVIQTRKVRFNGVTVEEFNARGNAFIVGVRDKRIEVDLTALIGDTHALLEIGDTFEMEVNGKSETFTCNVSELTESSEEAATLHIAGRTYTK